MKIAITGGHLPPALSVIEALSKDTKVLFVGRKYALEGDKAFSLEYQTITKLGIPFEEIKTGRMQRKFTFYTIPSLLKLPLGFVRAFSILKKFKPDVVLGFGGYVSVPVGIVAYLMRIPLVIHEQALEAGLANKILSRFAAKVCISWEETRIFFPKEKVAVTGLPLRNFQLSTFNSQLDKKLPLIYITGGSLGSHFINNLIEGCLREILANFNLVHQTGDAKEYGDFDRLERLKNGLPYEFRQRYKLQKFIDPKEVGLVLSQADLIVGRSGINTIAELIFFKKPALLIPLPYLREQIKNARFFKNLGLGEILLQKDATSIDFLKTVKYMFGLRQDYKKNAQKASSLIKKDAVFNIIEVVEDVIGSKKN